MLPGLVAFYYDHARFYLSNKNRPVPPNGRKQGSLAEDDKFADPRRWETLLAVEQAQSTIDGRNGSNACTIISGLFVHNFLSACESQIYLQVHFVQSWQMEMICMIFTISLVSCCQLMKYYN